MCKYTFMKACILLCILNCLSGTINYLEDETTSENSIIAKVISQFQEHNIVFHYENTTQQRVDSIVFQTIINTTIMMQNYDLPFMLRRPDGYSFFHAILLRNYSRFVEYTSLDLFSLQYVDVVFIVLNLDDDKDKYFRYWKGNLLHKAGAMFAFDTWTMQLYTVCFYCREKSMDLQRIDILSDDKEDNFNMSVNLVDIYENQFLDFNGHVFKVGYITYKPFFWCDLVSVSEDNQTNLLDFWGPEGWLLITLIRQLNMRFALEEHDDPENNWVHIIEAVQHGKLDWAIGGITLTIKRAQVVDFTNIIHNEAYTVFYSVYDDPMLSWMNIMLPFEFSVWGFLVLVIGVVCCLMFGAIRLFGNEPDVELFYLIQQGYLRYIVEQPLPRIKDEIRSRWTTMILISLWLIIAMVMTNAYKSKLTSSLITKRVKEYHTIDELVEADYDFFLSKDDSSVIREILESSGDHISLEILKRSRNDTKFCEAILQTAYQNVAVIDEETNFHYSVQEFCRSILPPTTLDNFRILRPLAITAHAWPMPLNTPFRSAVNRVISRISSAGLLAKWVHDFTASSGVFVQRARAWASVQDTGDYGEFRLGNMVGPMVLYAVGMVIAGGWFIWEVLRGKEKII